MSLGLAKYDVPARVDQPVDVDLHGVTENENLVVAVGLVSRIDVDHVTLEVSFPELRAAASAGLPHP